MNVPVAVKGGLEGVKMTRLRYDGRWSLELPRAGTEHTTRDPAVLLRLCIEAEFAEPIGLDD